MWTFRALRAAFLCTSLLALLPAEEARGAQYDASQASMESVNAAIRNGDYDAALRDALLLLERAQAAAGDRSVEVAAAQDRIGQIQRALGAYAESELAYEAAYTAYSAARGADHPDVQRVAEILIDIYLSQGRMPEAIALARQTLRAQEQALGEKHPDLQSALNRVASLHRAAGDLDTALRDYERLLDIQERALTPRSPDLLATVNTLGQLHRERGEPARAIPYLQRLLAHAEQTYGPLHPGLADMQTTLADTYTEATQYDAAEELYLQALQFQERLQGNNPELAAVLEKMAAMYAKSGDEDKQRLYERRLGESSAQTTTAASGR